MRRLIVSKSRDAAANLLVALPVAAALVSAGPARAEARIVETSTLTTQYSYRFYEQPGALTTIFTNSGSFRAQSDGPNAGLSELGADITSELSPDGDFRFLHNAYCVGRCALTITTEIVFTLTNVGDAAANIRFDSLVTPGHLAEVKLEEGRTGGNQRAQFSFDVRGQNSTDSSEDSLAFLFGQTGEDTLFTNPAFNGSTHGINDGNTAQVLDWSATNLNVTVPTIAAGETYILRYLATTSVNSQDSEICTQLSDCHGIQIAFGDPRNNGSASRGTLSARAADPVQSIIGARFDAYESSLAFVPQTTALPSDPPILAPIAYGPTFVSQVPEPGAWTMLIAGFGAIGAAFRRRPRLYPNRPVR